MKNIQVTILKIILILILWVLISFKVSTKSLAVEANQPTCVVTVDQVSEDDKILNEFNKTTVYRTELLSKDILRFTFDFSSASDDFYKSFIGYDPNDKFAGLLQNAYINFNTNKLIGCKSESLFKMNVKDYYNQITVYTPVKRNCSFESNFTVAMQSQSGGTIQSICEQPITVVPKTYNQVLDELSSALGADISITPDNNLFDITSNWIVDIENIKIPSSLITLTSAIDIRLGPPNVRGNILNFSKNTQSLYSFPGVNANLILDEGNLLYAKIFAGDKSMNFSLKPLNSGNYGLYLLITYDIFHVAVIKEQQFSVNVQGAPTPTPTPTVIPAPPENECDALVSNNSGQLNGEICRKCNQYDRYKAACEGYLQQLTDLKKICDSVPDNPDTVNVDENDECARCLDGRKLGDNISGSYTAIGCLPTDLPTFLKKYLWTVGLGLAGGIAFLLMLWGAFNIIISGGDAKKIAQNQEMIVSAITGLLFIIFSVLILRIIGFDVLKIPGFT